MASHVGDNTSETIDIRGWGAPVAPETAHSVSALGGNDTVHGSAYKDFLHGGDGNDILYGYDGNDALLGGNGNDDNYGGAGNDSIYDTAGDDFLYGGIGNDLLWGGSGNDIYVHFAGDGIDTINDDKTPTGQTGVPGYGGGYDELYVGYALAELQFLTSGTDNNLYITTVSDWADGIFNEGIIIEDFFIGGNFVVETLVTRDYYAIDLTQLLA